MHNSALDLAAVITTTGLDHLDGRTDVVIHGELSVWDGSTGIPHGPQTSVSALQLVYDLGRI
jgi:hypothetical protein